MSAAGDRHGYMIKATTQGEGQSMKAPVALILGLVGWLPLGASLFAAIGDASHVAVAIPLGIAGVVAISGVGLAVMAVASRASSLTAVTSGLAIVLNAALLIAAASLAATVRWQ
jgi:hypothetical protein